MLSFRSSQALVIIQHYTHFSLYLSDETGTYYSLSLEDLVVGNNAIDLEIVSDSVCLSSTCLCYHIIIVHSLLD